MTQFELEKQDKDERKAALQAWFQGLIADSDSQLVPVSGDASFRRYFRGFCKGQSYILVDAPPDKEDSRPFVRIARKFLELGINVPEVFELNYTAGFLCLSDFGDTLLWEKLEEARQGDSANAFRLYQLAFKPLLKIQSCQLNEKFSLPLFDETLLHKEMTLFSQWFCQDLLELSLSDDENTLVESSYRLLIESALAQPQVCVHRDYHSRNLLYQQVHDGGKLGVIDFQDAVLGPFTYDLVSLLKDCYIQWPADQVKEWALHYARLALSKNIITELDEEAFLESFALMGVQRHLKAIGIFSRLYLRDERLAYLADIPRTLNYVREVVKDHEGLQEFSHWLEAKVVPHVDSKIQSILAGTEQT